MDLALTATDRIRLRERIVEAAMPANHTLPLYAEYRRIDAFGAVVGLVNVIASMAISTTRSHT